VPVAVYNADFISQKDVLIPVLNQNLRSPTLLIIPDFTYFHVSLLISIGCKLTIYK